MLIGKEKKKNGNSGETETRVDDALGNRGNGSFHFRAVGKFRAGRGGKFSQLEILKAHFGFCSNSGRKSMEAAALCDAQAKVLAYIPVATLGSAGLFSSILNFLSAACERFRAENGGETKRNSRSARENARENRSVSRITDEICL